MIFDENWPNLILTWGTTIKSGILTPIEFWWVSEIPEMVVSESSHDRSCSRESNHHYSWVCPHPTVRQESQERKARSLPTPPGRKPGKPWQSVAPRNPLKHCLEELGAVRIEAREPMENWWTPSEIPMESEPKWTNLDKVLNECPHHGREKKCISSITYTRSWRNSDGIHGGPWIFGGVYLFECLKTSTAERFRYSSNPSECAVKNVEFQFLNFRSIQLVSYWNVSY